MRILLLAPDPPGVAGGIQQTTRLYCSALEDLGFESDLLVYRGKEPDALPPSVRFHSAGGSRWRFFRTLQKLRRPPEVGAAMALHLGLASPLRLLDHWRHLPWAVMVHGREISPIPVRRRRELEVADLIIAPSRYSLALLSRGLSLPENRLRLLPHSLPPSWSECEPAPLPPGLPPGRWILTVSRLDVQERYKGHEEILRSLPSIVAEMPDVSYVVVGDGDLLPSLRDLARTLRVESHVVFTGPVNDPILHALYRRAFLFAMPSRGEGFGLVYLEAMHHGKPIVAGQSDAASEIIHDGITGLLVQADSVESVRGALQRLLRNESEANEMGRRGLLRLTEQFSYPQFCSRLKELLETLLASRKTGTVSTGT